LTKLESVGDFAFYNSIKTTSTDRTEGKKLLLPSSLKTIGAAAFGYGIDTRT